MNTEQIIRKFYEKECVNLDSAMKLIQIPKFTQLNILSKEGDNMYIQKALWALTRANFNGLSITSIDNLQLITDNKFAFKGDYKSLESAFNLNKNAGLLLIYSSEEIEENFKKYVLEENVLQHLSF